MRAAEEPKARGGATRSRTYQFSVLGLFLLVTACGLFFGFARLVGSFPLLMAALSIGLTLAMVLLTLGMAKMLHLHYHPKPWCKYVELGFVFVPLGAVLLRLIIDLIAYPGYFDVSLLPNGCLFLFMTVLFYKSWKKRWADIAAKELSAASERNSAVLQGTTAK